MTTRPVVASWPRPEAGFTLVELLVVIVILGILAGIAILVVSEFRDDAVSQCQKANNRITATVNVAVSVGGSGSYVDVDGSC